ncbi:ClbS/DfsB family four-helix bundle protein [Yoonia sp. F2084L]|uniref:ClbS/DfsB family four-helix bundle protein n=1 Tax=Yoonia sp. F2084L TaxID=2926419 RepID=UPI001FF14FAD|nr:ClbS/DfsB family four-helix bundle protein [Yoonia sp. F2084L]MCK0094599.1 ClbS/DfsB family four-helix bundle protein [Yoonia sp. F2084L]
MPAATNKSDLRIVTEKEFNKLSGILENVTAAQAAAPYDETCIKDVIGHRAHWTQLFFGWYADGQAGKQVFFPAEGYKWNDLKRYNADLRQSQANLNWDDVQKMLQDSYHELIAFIDAHSDADLYGGPMKGANNKWTPGRWAEAAGPSHYRSAAKYVRATLRAAA